MRGLDAGADDYLTKPFPFGVLLARLRGPLPGARSGPRWPSLQVEIWCSTPPRTGSPARAEAIALTATEYRVLEFLMRRAGRAVSRSAIIEGVWGFEEDIEANTVDAFIRLLREKIDAGDERKVIQTVRGYGYILREDRVNRRSIRFRLTALIRGDTGRDTGTLSPSAHGSQFVTVSTKPSIRNCVRACAACASTSPASESR